MPAGNVLIGRQPILDVNQNIIAFELLFRSENESAGEAFDNLSATASVLVNVLNNLGINKLLGDKLGFINVNEEIIKKNILKPLQRERFVLEILESTKIDQEFLNSAGIMKQEGYTFALDDFVFDARTIKRFEALFNILSYVKVDVKLNTHEMITSKLNIFKPYPVDYLAEKIENMEEFDFYKKSGFKYFQGYFFSKPAIIKGRGIDPRKLAIMEIINLIFEDSDIEKLESTFKKYPEMTINLLEFINSASIGSRNRIESVRQALALLGHRQLMNWMILMEYAFKKESLEGNPLLFSAIERAKTMEILLRTIKKDIGRTLLEEAYLTGLLSLMDALFQAPMEEILPRLNLSPDITDALLGHNNLLGKLLLIVKNNEEDNFKVITSLLKEIEMSMEDYTRASLQAYCSTHESEALYSRNSDL